MKNICLILLSVSLYSCSSICPNSGSNRVATPKVYKMSQKQKDNLNYDLKQSKKVIAHNIKHKKSNQKAAEKKRQIDTENAMLLNSSAKAKKEKKNNAQAFNFYL